MNYLRLLFLLSLPLSGFTQQPRTWVVQPDTVILYPQQALIRSQVKIQLPAGKSTFLLSGFGPSLEFNSIQATSKGNWKILSVTTELSDAPSPGTAIRDSLLNLDKEIRRLEMQIQVTEQQEKIILANASIKSESDGLIPEDFKEFMSIFEQKLMDVGKKRLMLNEQLVLARAKRNQWEKPSATTPQVPPVLRILAEAPQDMTTEVSVAYVVNQASWTPHYTARVQDLNQPITVTFQADIQQQTGMDWQKAHIILSTARPQLGGNKPTILPEFLQIYEPQAISRRTAKIAPATADMMMESPILFSRAPESEVVFENLDLFMQYTLPGLYRIPQGDLPTRLDVQTFTWQPTYSYSLVPKQSADGFVQAELSSNVLKNLISGRLTLFWNGTFLGESYLDTRVRDLPTIISLGRDQSLQAKAEEVLDKKSFRTMGSSVRESQVFRYTLTNRKNQDVRVKVEEQVPISKDSRIEVSSELIPDATINTETGMMTWEVAIPAGGSVVLTKTIHIKYPKGVQLQRKSGWN